MLADPNRGLAEHGLRGADFVLQLASDSERRGFENDFRNSRLDERSRARRARVMCAIDPRTLRMDSLARRESDQVHFGMTGKQVLVRVARIAREDRGRPLADR